MNMGLLPTAMAEAKVAAQHAGLAAKATTLPMVQTHAGHVINAIDPTIVAQGPGAGYGVKKAAQGVAQHATLAANAADANAMVKTHSMHVSTAANNVVTMSDEIVAIAQKIRMSTSLEEAQKLAADMQAKAEQLTTGVDADKNGQLTRTEIEQFQKLQAVADAQARNRSLFAQLDADKNGQISAAEFTKMVTPPPVANAGPMLSREDSNRDQQISLVEHRIATLANFDRLDTDRDGVVTPAEMKAGGIAPR